MQEKPHHFSNIFTESQVIAVTERKKTFRKELLLNISKYILKNCKLHRIYNLQRALLPKPLSLSLLEFNGRIDQLDVLGFSYVKKSLL